MMAGEWLFTILACIAMAVLAVMLLYLLAKDTWKAMRPREQLAVWVSLGICAAIVLLICVARVMG